MRRDDVALKIERFYCKQRRCDANDGIVSCNPGFRVFCDVPGGFIGIAEPVHHINAMNEGGPVLYYIYCYCNMQHVSEVFTHLVCALFHT